MSLRELPRLGALSRACRGGGFRGRIVGARLRAMHTGDMSAHIRRARLSDLDALVALEQASFDHDRVSRTQFRRHLASTTACVLVVADRRNLLGCALLFFRRGAHSARLYSIAIAHAARGRGLGAALLQAAEHEAHARGCAALRLEVRTDNKPATTLYEKRGYQRQAREPGFYEDGTDAWRYAKPLR